MFYLPAGDYRLRADREGTQFWSSEENACTIPGCENVIISVTLSVTVNVVDTNGTPVEGLNVYAFDGETYSNYSEVTDENGQAVFSLPEGDYHFRADLNGTQFWSADENTCTLPGCISDSVTVTKPLIITVVDSDGTAKSGLNVYAFNGTTYAGYSKVTNESGQAVFTLLEGDYRFRADLNGTQFWSGTENHCTLPGCESAGVSVTKPLTVTVHNSDGTAQSGLNVYAFNGTTYAGYSKVTNESGQAVFTLPEGDYRFRADLNGTHFWSAEANHCTLPGCESVDVSVTVPLTVSVTDTDGSPQSGIAVYAFNGTTYMNFSKTTDEYGQAVFTLPQGDYRFRADAGGTQYWSSEENDCTLPGCSAASVTTSKPVTVSVVDSLGMPQMGLSVYAFDGTTYSGYSKVTDENGAASFYLPSGDYRFRADSGGTQYWSSEENACTIPGCESVIISVTLPVTVTVVDTDGMVQEGLSVYAFDGETYSNYSKVTDENGQAVFNLPVGAYRFRADLNGTQFWSADENTCTLPGCISDSVTVTKPVTVTVAGEEGNPYVEVTVYAFDGEMYAGYSAVTDAGGQVVFTLPEGDYHFRANYDGVEFWSGNENTCTIPGCEEDSVILPGGTGEQEVSIDYTYDALNRLISVEYSNGTAFGYTYDAAGNVLTYTETYYGQTTFTSYTYDAANQLLTAVEDDPSTSSGTEWYYTYDGNGSLIQTYPGASAANGSTRYTYNTAGYLTKVENYTTEWQTRSEMTYDGLGNRLEVTTYSDGEGNTTRYVLDSGTTLAAYDTDGSTFYLYGHGSIGTFDESWNYILSDGSRSTRQLTDGEGSVKLSVSYTPWGDIIDVYGDGLLYLSFLGAIYDSNTGLIYLGHGIYYNPINGKTLIRTGNNVPVSPLSSDPASMIIAPLILIGLVFGRKKNKNKLDNLLVSFVLLLLIGFSLYIITASSIITVKAQELDPHSDPCDPLNEDHTRWILEHLPVFTLETNNPSRPYKVKPYPGCVIEEETVINRYPTPDEFPLDTILSVYYNSCIFDIALKNITMPDDISSFPYSDRANELFKIYLQMFNMVYNKEGKLTWWWREFGIDDMHFSIAEFATILYTHETSNASRFMTDSELDLLVEAIGRKSYYWCSTNGCNSTNYEGLLQFTSEWSQWSISLVNQLIYNPSYILDIEKKFAETKGGADYYDWPKKIVDTILNPPAEYMILDLTRPFDAGNVQNDIDWRKDEDSTNDYAHGMLLWTRYERFSNFSTHSIFFASFDPPGKMLIIGDYCSIAYIKNEKSDYVNMGCHIFPDGEDQWPSP